MESEHSAEGAHYRLEAWLPVQKSAYGLGEQASVLTADILSALSIQVRFARMALAHRNVVWKEEEKRGKEGA